MSDICYCWHPKVGFYYYCHQHKPNKPASELREVALVDMLGKSNCAECGILLKPVQQSEARENMVEIGSTVTFRDEHNNKKIGIVTSLDPYGQPGTVGIITSLHDGVYVRTIGDVHPSAVVIERKEV